MQIAQSDLKGSKYPNLHMQFLKGVWGAPLYLKSSFCMVVGVNSLVSSMPVLLLTQVIDLEWQFTEITQVISDSNLPIPHL